MANLADIIDSQTDAFLSELPKFQRELYREIEKELLKLATKDGKLFISKANDAISNGLAKKIQDYLKDSKFKNLVERFLDNFDDINANIEKLQKQENNISVPKTIFERWKIRKREEVIQALLTSGIDVNFSTPIRNLLNDRIYFGATLSDTLETMKNTVLGDAERQGMFERYTTQIARDTLRNYTGSVNQTIANQYELNAYRYIGSIVKDSRPQCERWVEMDVILFSDLQDEIDWAYNNGKGMIPNTTPENFAQHCGGYNCRHTAIPIRVETKQD